VLSCARRRRGGSGTNAPQREAGIASRPVEDEAIGAAVAGGSPRSDTRAAQPHPAACRHRGHRGPRASRTPHPRNALHVRRRLISSTASPARSIPARARRPALHAGDQTISSGDLIFASPVGASTETLPATLSMGGSRAPRSTAMRSRARAEPARHVLRGRGGAVVRARRQRPGSSQSGAGAASRLVPLSPRGTRSPSSSITVGATSNELRMPRSPGAMPGPRT
jgi:hypothetical protein